MQKVRVEKDFEEFIKLLNKYKVEYVVIGAYAVSFHARPRNTGDIDFLVGKAKDNIQRLMKALEQFGFGNVGLKSKDFLNPDTVVQLGYEPNRIDILTEIAGLHFEKVYKSRVGGRFGKQRVWFISLSDLMVSKKAAARKQDKADLELLAAYSRKQRS